MKIDSRIVALLKGQPGEVTDATFDALVLQNSGAVVVDFWADYCSPCHMVMPLVYKLAHEYDGRITVLKMDTESNNEVFKKYQLRGVPTLLFFFNGELVDQQVGYAGYDPLREQFEALTIKAGHASITDTRELVFASAVAAAEETFEVSIEPAAEAYRKAAAPFQADYQAACEAAQAEHAAGRLTDEELRAAYQTAYEPMQAATKPEGEAYRAAAETASEARYAALGAAIEAYVS